MGTRQLALDLTCCDNDDQSNTIDTITRSSDIAEMYENAGDDEQQYIQNLALFLTGFLGVHLKVRSRLTVARVNIHRS